jgi:hypothetical protein
LSEAAADKAEVLRYEPSGYRWFHLIFVVSLWAFVAFAATRPHLLRDLVPLVVMAVATSYWLLAQTGYRLEVREGHLLWSALARSRRVPMVEVTLIRSASNQVVVRAGDRTVARLWIAKGLPAFSEAVHERYPHVEVVLDRTTRWQDRLPGRSAFSRRRG